MIQTIHEDRQTLRLDDSIEALQIDGTVQRIFPIVVTNAEGGEKQYHLKVTPKGGLTLV